MLTATPSLVKGKHRIDLVWTPVGPGNVDVYRNGARIVTTLHDGSYTDNTGRKGAAQYVHRVCLAGTAICSNDVTSIFN